jgi:cytochrome c oxidase subunit 4
MSENQHHVVPVKYYALIGGTLLLMTYVTYAVSKIDLGPLNTIVALSIATFKATLVVLIFMHVKYTNEKMTKPIIASAIFFLLLLLILSLADYGTRSTWNPYL